MSRKPTAVFVTAIRPEFRAVIQHLSNTADQEYKGTWYEVGEFVSSTNQSWKVAVVEIGQGNTAAAAETDRAIEFFDPTHVFFVGVAGGIKDVKLGDVVAANKIYGYESGKQTADFKSRPEIGESTHAMIQLAMATARKESWLEKLQHKPEVLIAPIAAGSKVLADTRSPIYEFIRQTYNDAVAVEMEGIGFLDTIHRHQTVNAIRLVAI